MKTCGYWTEAPCQANNLCLLGEKRKIIWKPSASLKLWTLWSYEVWLDKLHVPLYCFLILVSQPVCYHRLVAALDWTQYLWDTIPDTDVSDHRSLLYQRYWWGPVYVESLPILLPFSAEQNINKWKNDYMTSDKWWYLPWWYFSTMLQVVISSASEKHF